MSQDMARYEDIENLAQILLYNEYNEKEVIIDGIIDIKNDPESQGYNLKVYQRAIMKIFLDNIF